MLFIILLILWMPFFIAFRYDYSQAFVRRFPIVYDSDIAARWGGEEFTVLLPHDNKEKAIEKAEKVRLAISSRIIPHVKTQLSEKHITVSIGVATLTPSETKTSRELLTLADNALYSAKENGRNRISFGVSP